jgi:hypothetical protein
LDLTSVSLLLDSFVCAVADRVVEKLAAPKTPDRIPLAKVTEHGAPSERWVTARAREGAPITIHGPRGGRFVWANELAALLASTTIRRRGRPPAGADLAADVRGAVAALAARRAAK